MSDSAHTVPCPVCDEGEITALYPSGRVVGQSCRCDLSEGHGRDLLLDDLLDVEMDGPEPDEDRLLARSGLGRWP